MFYLHISLHRPRSFNRVRVKRSFVILFLIDHHLLLRHISEIDK